MDPERTLREDQDMEPAVLLVLAWLAASMPVGLVLGRCLRTADVETRR